LGACLYAEHPCLKPSVEKRGKKNKMTQKILMSLGGQQNLTRGMNLRGKLNRAQVELL